MQVRSISVSVVLYTSAQWQPQESLRILSHTIYCTCTLVCGPVNQVEVNVLSEKLNEWELRNPVRRNSG
jgi:hypothetical protein